MKDPIIVTGGPRSGTTLTMKFLQACGMEVGASAARSTLVEGRIRDELYKPILASGGFDPRAQNPLPPLGWQPEMSAERFRSAVLALAEIDVTKNAVWGFKAIKGLLFWRLVNEAFPKAKWIVIHREREEHIDSLLRTSFMNTYTTREGWDRYLTEIDEHMLDLIAEIDNWEQFEPAELREEKPDIGRLTYLCEWCGLTFNKQALSVFDSSKYKKHS